MKIIYNQDDFTKNLENTGIKNCYVKQFNFNRDKDTYTKKPHHHNDFEIHFIISGQQTYDVNNKKTAVGKGYCLIIPPTVTHRVVFCDESTEKVSISFNYDYKTDLLKIPQFDGCFIIKISSAVCDSINLIKEESNNSKYLSSLLIENRITEIIISLLRLIGINEKSEKMGKRSEPQVLNMAKQYINDNIKSAPLVHDVALYCNMSEKQLTRLFLQYEEVSTSQYIKKQRLEAIKKMLMDKSISLKTISEEMNFSNEYYFNIFFKNAYGMPPGIYRKMF